MIRHKKSNKLFIISVINLVIGITLFTYNSVYDYYLNMLDKNKVDNYINDSKIKVNIVSIDNENTINNEEVNNYLGVISIPKINLEQGFYGIDNPMNNVDKNIELISNSNMPDVENGTLILAAHSGNDRVSYFNKLYKLNIDDEIEIIYNKSKYLYKLIDIYEVEKTGSITLHNINNITSLVLVTCSNFNDNLQVVYISRLVNVSEM
ncbi:MAG: sortase [Bacilli bacterium]|nr:sortase [Bacilli bacterium]